MQYLTIMSFIVKHAISVTIFPELLGSAHCIGDGGQKRETCHAAFCSVGECRSDHVRSASVFRSPHIEFTQCSDAANTVEITRRIIPLEKSAHTHTQSYNAAVVLCGLCVRLWQNYKASHRNPEANVAQVDSYFIIGPGGAMTRSQ